MSFFMIIIFYMFFSFIFLFNAYLIFYCCSENLVTIGMNFLIPREDMVSLVAPLRIRWCIIDCYCLYLNEKACFDSGPRKFFFGVRQSVSNLIFFYMH